MNQRSQFVKSTEGYHLKRSSMVSPIVVVPRPNDPENVRITLHMRAANHAIKCVKHPMLTIDKLIHDLNGCRVFTKLDLAQGYHQIELHP